MSLMYLFLHIILHQARMPEAPMQVRLALKLKNNCSSFQNESRFFWKLSTDAALTILIGKLFQTGKEYFLLSLHITDIQIQL